KLERANNLRAKAIQPAVQEVNALAPFSVQIEEQRTGRAVSGFRLYWWRKSADEYRAAMAELERPRTGRGTRIRNRAEV
ncbi:replication initiation protein, partial [Klebsiella pneumoniae]|uniref:replication initiation protein n=1 Tax=Klebsiella pneumoniae TaxID=573 RepID=UPI0013303E4A